METKEYKLSVECNRVIVASIDMTAAANMMLIHHNDKSLYSMLIDAIIDWIVGNKLKGVLYEDVENAAIDVVEKLKDYVFTPYQHKYYSSVHMMSKNYSLLFKENDGKSFFEIIQHDWMITCDNIKVEQNG